MVSDPTSSARCDFCMDYKIPFIHCSSKLKFVFNLTLLPKSHPACRNDANAIKPGNNSKTTDKYAAEYAKSACLGVN